MNFPEDFPPRLGIARFPLRLAPLAGRSGPAQIASAFVLRLFPVPPEDVDPVAAYAADDRPAPADRPWVLMNMISSVDGGTAVDGVSGGLGGEADKSVFSAVRGVADVILVASATAKAESYGPPRTPPSIQEQRRGRGQAPKPAIAVITGRLDLDFGRDLFHDPESDALVIAPEDAPAERRAAVPSHVELLSVGRGRVDLGGALQALRDRGAGVVLNEGGPSLQGQLVAADLVDEVCLSFSPTLLAGDSRRIVHGGAVPSGLLRLTLERVMEMDSFLFFRYVRDRH